VIPTPLLSLACNRKRLRRKRYLQLNPKNKKRQESHLLKRSLPKGREKKVGRESPLDQRPRKKKRRHNPKKRPKNSQHKYKPFLKCHYLVSRISNLSH